MNIDQYLRGIRDDVRAIRRALDGRQTAGPVTEDLRARAERRRSVKEPYTWEDERRRLTAAQAARDALCARVLSMVRNQDKGNGTYRTRLYHNLKRVPRERVNQALRLLEGRGEVTLTGKKVFSLKSS